eukprot:46488-Eustigmatos_ZCMA.PRE.1
MPFDARGVIPEHLEGEGRVLFLEDEWGKHSGVPVGDDVDEQPIAGAVMKAYMVALEKVCSRTNEE